MSNKHCPTFEQAPARSVHAEAIARTCSERSSLRKGQVMSKWSSMEEMKIPELRSLARDAHQRHGVPTWESIQAVTRDSTAPNAWFSLYQMALALRYALDLVQDLSLPREYSATDRIGASYSTRQRAASRSSSSVRSRPPSDETMPGERSVSGSWPKSESWPAWDAEVTDAREDDDNSMIDPTIIRRKDS
jgi:hypothetical protein